MKELVRKTGRGDGKETADDAEISGATGNTYTLAAFDEGKAVKVRVSFTDDVGYTETLASAATPRIWL